MDHHYKEYCWKDGLPMGSEKADSLEGISYRILADPYRKWISIEQYRSGVFESVVYDSNLFDFRTLKTLNQAAWLKEKLSENEGHVRCLLRNQDDRAVLVEDYHFQHGKCHECRTTSIHGLPVSHQKILYKEHGSPFNGVILYDANDHIVMEKRYEIDKESGEFGELLSENWNVKIIPIPERICMK